MKELWLDIDELDSKTKLMIARLKVTAGYYSSAVKSWIDSFLFSVGESKIIKRFDKIYTSTREEMEAIEQVFGLQNVETFENMLPAEYIEHADVPEEVPFRFLFVGDSNYFPNLDAIDRIIFDIIPKLKRVTVNPFCFVIIGGKVGKKQSREIAKHECIEYHEDVRDLMSIYRRTHAAIIPLRAGGGSSLKFLEAMRHYKPVISTPIGVRGFNVEHGKHVLIGNDANEIAMHCKSLIENQELTERLSKSGYHWFIENNSYKIASKVKEFAGEN